MGGHMKKKVYVIHFCASHSFLCYALLHVVFTIIFLLFIAYCIYWLLVVQYSCVKVHYCCVIHYCTYVCPLSIIATLLFLRVIPSRVYCLIVINLFFYCVSVFNCCCVIHYCVYFHCSMLVIHCCARHSFLSYSFPCLLFARYSSLFLFCVCCYLLLCYLFITAFTFTVGTLCSSFIAARVIIPSCVIHCCVSLLLARYIHLLHVIHV